MNRVFSLILLTVFFLTPKIYAQSDDKNIQTVIHLLSYISLDYSVAVENGKVIDDGEYTEMTEFSNQALKLITDSKLSQNKGVTDDLNLLIELIHQKKAASEISTVADRAKNNIIQVSGVKTAPLSWPDIKAGEAIYRTVCADCHGMNGNGEGAQASGLNPEPTNFLEDELMEKLSAYHAFNSIKLGVQGTSMRPYPEYSDDDIWNLAFYVKSLRFKGGQTDSVYSRSLFDAVFDKVSLAEVASLSDVDLLAKLNGKSDTPEATLVALRTMIPSGKNIAGSIRFARQHLWDALDNYKSGNKSLSRTLALNAYLEGFEPVEARLRSIDSKFVVEVEAQMLAVRQAIEKDKGNEVIESEINNTMTLLDQAEKLLGGQKLNYWLTFILAASIFLREGLEAFLILAVVLALIRTTGVKKALPWLHGGWITAVLAGIAGWFLSDYILQFGGKNREILEGVVALLAVAVLLSVGYWLHNKTHASQWKKFVEEKIGQHLNRDRMIGLAAFSFMIVFREAFEVVLFLQAINLESSGQNQSAIGLGVLASSLVIALIAFLFQKYSSKLPIREIFKYSSWLIVLLAVILMGKGIHALQESGWIGVTTLPSVFRLEWLGIYPTLETVLGQLGILAIIAGTVYFHDAKIKKLETKASH